MTSFYNKAMMVAVTVITGEVDNDPNLQSSLERRRDERRR